MKKYYKDTWRYISIPLALINQKLKNTLIAKNIV